MARELGRFYLTMSTVLVLNRRYFRAHIKEWGITTVITVMTLVFDVETLQVRVNDEIHIKLTLTDHK